MTGVRTVESSREVQYDLFVLRISNGGLIEAMEGLGNVLTIPRVYESLKLASIFEA